MALLVDGVRVVRGPNWSHGDQDGGEGHVGTVTQNNEDNTVEVQWDMGESGTYSTGKDGKSDLRILDSGPAGLKHIDVKCGACSCRDFPGTRWKCQGCPNYDLCSTCYFTDKHNLQHLFLRIDAPGVPGSAVPKRSTSIRLRSLGIYSGAKVKRGIDWNAGNQDGGTDQIGTVIDVKNYGTCGHERDAVRVAWTSKDENTYRLGYRGKVDLLCVEEMPGTDYYRDHLLPLSTCNLARTNQDTQLVSMRSSIKSASLRREKSTLLPGLQVGETVCVMFPEMALKEMQRGHGGWSMRMNEYIGQHGQLKRFEENGDCVINFDGKEYRVNANAVGKVPSFKLNETVRILEDMDQVVALQKRHGGWQAEMKSILGKVGKIVKIDTEGDVAVSFGSDVWVFNPACCVSAPGESLEVDKSENDSSSASSSSSSNEDNNEGNDSDNDIASETLGHLIASLFLLHSGVLDVGPKLLITAAANNNNNTVQKILKENPALINEKHQGLTALIIAAHEGHVEVVKTLLRLRANPNLTEEKGNTALMAALMKSRDEVAILLINAGTKLDICNESMRCALHFAASNKVNKTLKELLKRGANPNQQDNAGDTALHDAIINTNDLGAAFLVADQRTNLKLCNKRGFPPLHWAALKDCDVIVDNILSVAPELKNDAKRDGFTPLHVAAINDNCSVIKVILKKKANVDQLTDKQATPLHLASTEGYIATCKLLLETCANINAQDRDGDTPLHCCVMGRRSDGINPLALLMGVRVVNESEMTDRTNLACLLIQHDANMNIRNKRGRTPLECCSDDKMRNAIKMFAENQGKGNRYVSGATGHRAANLLSELFMGLRLPCMACMEKMADAKFEPCGHKVCCQRCSFRVRDCPMCDTAITARTDLEGNRLAKADSCTVQ